MIYELYSYHVLHSLIMSTTTFMTIQLATIPFEKLPEVVRRISLIAVNNDKKNKKLHIDTDDPIKKKKTCGYFMHNTSQRIDHKEPMDKDIAEILTAWAINDDLHEDQYKFIVNLLAARKALVNTA
jgi:hypothetical protein